MTDLYRLHSAVGKHFAVRKKRLQTAVLQALTLLIGGASGAVFAGTEPADVTFDSTFLQGYGQNLDLSRYARAGLVPAGEYRLQVTVNGKDQMSQTVRVVAAGKNASRFCFRAADVERWGVRVNKLPDQEQVAKTLASDCVEVQALIPGASFRMDMASLQGDLSIPQAYAGRVRRGYVDPSEWDSGVTAGFVTYNANAFENQNSVGDDSSSFSLGVNSGFNIADWRLRHNGNFNYDDDAGSTYSATNSYAQHDVSSMKAQFTLGEYFTPGDSFDSVPFTGVQLASDDSMLPESERGFAPIVRGIADTNAKVTIRQAGRIIHEVTVAPGAFVIDDLYATGYAGDLDVTVTEADGRQKTFTVAFASVVQMLRPGSSRFSLTVGRYRDDNLDDQLRFTQGTYRRGISNLLTLYGGGILAEDYGSLITGAAVGTPIGAIAFDASFSRASGLPQITTDEGSGDSSGRSYRISYSKLIDETRTNFALAAYRFSSEGYLGLSTFAHLHEGDPTQAYLERNRFQVSVSQPMGEVGDFYVNGVSSSYWDGRADSTTYQVGYSKSFNWGSLSVSAGREFQDDESNDTYLLSLSVPLGSGSRRPTLSTTASYDGDNNSTVRTNVTGTAGERNQANYGVYASRSSSDDDSTHSYGGNVQYRSSIAQVGASVSRGEDFTQYTGSASGTVVAHSGGIVFSPEQGETMALIEARGAGGASVANGQGNALDDDGQALTAGLVPYRNNNVGINPKGLPVDVELENTQQQVAPRRGAIVRLDYPTIIGKPLLLQLDNNADVPFGAQVVDADGKQIALVGQGGLIFVRGEHQGLKAVWGEDSGQSCLLRFDPATGAEDQLYQQVDATCVHG
jgi:outer membrane usher protein